MSNYNEVGKWFLISLWLKISFHKLQYLGGWHVILFYFPRVSRDVPNWYTTCWCPHTMVMPYTMICFHILAPKVLQTQATHLYLHAFNRSRSTFYDQSLQPLPWHSHMNFIVTWIILWTEKLWSVSMYIGWPLVQAIHNCLHIHSSHHLAFF